MVESLPGPTAQKNEIATTQTLLRAGRRCVRATFCAGNPSEKDPVITHLTPRRGLMIGLRSQDCQKPFIVLSTTA